MRQLKSPSARGCAFHFVETQSVICIYFLSARQILTEFCSLDPSFNRNILMSLYLKSEHLRMRNYATTLLNILYTNFATWCQLETYIKDTIDKWHQQTTPWLWLRDFSYKYSQMCTILLEIPTFPPAIKLKYEWNRFGERTMENLQIRIYF